MIISKTCLNEKRVSDTFANFYATMTRRRTLRIGFSGLYGSISVLATTLTLAAAINCIGIGFLRGTQTRPYDRSVS